MKRKFVFKPGGRTLFLAALALIALAISIWTIVRTHPGAAGSQALVRTALTGSAGPTATETAPGFGLGAA